MEEHPEVVPISASEASSMNLLRPGEGLRDARQRIIAQLIEKHPEFDDPFVLGSLRGEHGTMIVGVSPQEREAAPLIGQVYQLLELEMREHPERFRPPERR